MYALLGIIGLMISIYMRPYEWNSDLAKLPFLQVCCGLTLLGLVADLATRRTRFIRNPLAPFCTFFVMWSLITLVLVDPSLAVDRASPILISLLLFYVISFGVQTVAAFTRVIVTIFALGLFVAYVGVDQGTNDYGCLIVPPDRTQRLYYDGRPCPVTDEVPPSEAVAACYVNGKNVNYACEKPGLFMTSSLDGGRVRYLGVLADPNELALATSLALPLAFAFFELKRSRTRLLLLLFSVALIAVEVVFTKSRGGQIAFAAVLGAYFVRKYGIRRGMIVAGVMAVPLIILGGRSSESADQSSMERLEAAAAAIKLLLAYPIRGAGYTQFLEHHPLTAHNAYLLAAGELGLPGLLCFASMLFLCSKTMISVLRFDFDEDDPEGTTLKALAMAMLAIFAGISIGIFFLSWTYHFILWIHLGLAGALYSVVHTRYPQFRVRLTLKELGIIFGGAICALVVLTLYIKKKGVW